MRLAAIAAVAAVAALRGIGAADAAQLLFPLARRNDARFVVAGVQRQLGALALQVVLQGLDARAGVGLARLQLAALVVERGAPLHGLAALLVLPFPAQRAH